MKQKRIKSADDLLQLRQKTNKILCDKVNDIQNCIDAVNFGEVNKKVYDDFTKDLELLNERIFLLEKKVRKEGGQKKPKLDNENILASLSKLTGKLDGICNTEGGEKSLPTLEKFLESLTLFYNKQTQFENSIHHFNGF
jgi:hypothetical protein